jgi:hypothetical protein
LFLSLFLGIAAVYFIASLVFSMLISFPEAPKYIALLPISFAALHFGYGIGFGRGIIGLTFVGRIFRAKRRVKLNDI